MKVTMTIPTSLFPFLLLITFPTIQSSSTAAMAMAKANPMELDKSCCFSTHQTFFPPGHLLSPSLFFTPCLYEKDEPYPQTNDDDSKDTINQ
ncbi:hypothetical protein JOL62DRAFT_563852 [Phyllosticta paracitricarpa]|uniref:Transmembrane protein n=1 Tax=Phyllosticta paracitricarpa TaxID=2016321 RepID=A0ABR1NHS5_9PEZI